jgi:nitroreductase
LISAVFTEIANGSSEAAEFDVYPSLLPEPYKSRRNAVGEAMYGILGIPRSDKIGRAEWFKRNFEFFGAPVGLFIHTPKYMGAPQWADLGMWLQSVMLMLREEGMDSCAQEAWSLWPRTVRRFVTIPDDHILFAGMAIGYRDESTPINRLETDRVELSEATEFIGF